MVKTHLDRLPGDIVSIEFRDFPKLRHYGIVAEDISYVYDVSEADGNVEDSKKRTIVKKRKWEEFLKIRKESLQIENTEYYGTETPRIKERIITLERAAIIIKIYKESTFKERILSYIKKTINLPKPAELLKHIIDYFFKSNSTDYNLWQNNCQHVAGWCINGRWESAQVDAFHNPVQWGHFVPTSVSVSSDSSINLSGNNSFRRINLLLKFRFYQFLFRIKFNFYKSDKKINELLGELPEASTIKYKLLRKFDNSKNLFRLRAIVTVITFIWIIYSRINDDIVDPTPPVNPQVDNNKKSYTVKEGDNLSNISLRLCDDVNKVDKIRKANPNRIKENSDHIEPGWKLVIPDDCQRN